MIRCAASGFQIDDTTLFTIKHGEALIASGMIGIVWAFPDEIVLGEELDLRIRVTETNDDPKVVGVMDRPQRRIYWKGFIDLSADEIEALQGAQSTNGESSIPEQSGEEHQHKNESTVEQ